MITSGGIFDENDIEKKINEINTKTSEANFWKDNFSAQKILKEKKFLENIFINFNTDKGTSVIWNGKKINTHGYSIYYEKYLQEFKDKKINILEIGSHEGRAIASFYYYFPKILIHKIITSLKY